MSDQPSIFVGRQTQLDELNNYWQDAFHKNQGKVIFLIGEAGIGKTSLVQQFSQSVLKNYSQMQYARAQCDQVAGDISPYAPFVQVLNSLTEQAAKQGNNWFVNYMCEVGPDILNMVPAAGSLLTAATKSVGFVWKWRKRDTSRTSARSQFGQQDIFQQFTDTFLNIARKKNPLLLFIDDWHWADASSTNLLFHLAHRLGDVPILLLATYRPHDAKVREHPILNIHAEMKRHRLCANLLLDFLSRADVVDYLAYRFPTADPDPTLVDWLMNITEGNALFTTEYINLLINEKLVAPDGHLLSDLIDVTPPDNVEAVIRARIGYLDQEARDMLAYGSVEGEQFTTLLLSRLLDIKPLSLIRRFRTISETHQLIASLGQQTVYEQKTTVYHFVHTLVHRALYNMLEEEERVEINHLLLGLLGEIYAQADEATKAQMAPDLMAHAAEAKDFLAEARYALAAAEGAAIGYAHVEVLKQCARGLSALDKLAESTAEVQTLRLDLLQRRGRTEEFTGVWQQALETYLQTESLARAGEDPVKLIQVLNDMGWVLRYLGQYEQALNRHEEAVTLAERIGNKTELAHAYRGLSLLHWRLDQYDQAWEWSQKLLAIAEEIDDKAGVASAYNVMAFVYDKRREYDEALEFYQKEITVNEELGLKRELAWDYYCIAKIHTKQGDNQLGLKVYQQALELFQELGFERGEAAVYAGIGSIHTNEGEYDQALEWYERSMAINKKLEIKSGLGWNANDVGHIYAKQGNYDQALALYQQALTIWQELSFRQDEAVTSHHIGLLYQSKGDYRQALEWHQKTLTIWEALGVQKEIDDTHQHITAIEAKIAESDCFQD
jgi:tetratricopeptide (TPR) repeat protein/energy-coupling factor transporter ATP-binding protein EcfA2